MTNNNGISEVAISDTADGHELVTEQNFEQPLDEVFAFFADAFQLEVITPPWLKFRVVTPRPIDIRPGTLIDYRLKLHGIPIRWRSRITKWDPPNYFVDEQIIGPYRRWYHEHFIERRGDATIVRDVVKYQAPGGALVNRFFVRKDLHKIFQYRRKKMAEIFTEMQPSMEPN